MEVYIVLLVQSQSNMRDTYIKHTQIFEPPSWIDPQFQASLKKQTSSHVASQNTISLQKKER
jgi:hypothetical protein